MNFNEFRRRKSLNQILNEESDSAHGGGEGLKKSLRLPDLIAMGIAAVIGAGLFSTIGSASFKGGPGVILLFVITAITCGFTAMCYAEFAARVPVAGSAYTYSYVTFGEIVAWIIGWALILEYAIGNIVVAISWSSYFDNILRGVGIHLPAWLVTDGTTAHRLYDSAIKEGKSVADLAWTTAPNLMGWKMIMNVPACIIVILVTMLAYIGMKESKRMANAMVGLKLIVLFLVVGIGMFYISPSNWHPFMPNGFGGVMAGVSSVFFAYIGFDAISTTAEECENPQRDLPRGMIWSLVICTIIYIVTALVITGMVSYKEFEGVADPLAYVFDKIGLNTVGYAVSVSAVIAATSVLLVFQVGQPRIWMSMSRDGLLPKKFSHVHPKFQTPDFATIVTGFLVAIPALLMDANLVTDLTSIGTLFAFVLVCGGVLVLQNDDKKSGFVAEVKAGRFKLPYINGRFIVPAIFALFCWALSGRISGAFSNFTNQAHQEYLFLIFLVLATIVTVYTILEKWSLIPVLGILSCAYLMIEIPVNSWFFFFLWMALGLSVYLGYGYKRSKLRA